jgi:DNA-binding CsgD family transcriptional regulator
MAAIDPSQFKALYKHFPELTENQIVNVLLFSIGNNFDEIAEIRCVSVTTIKKGLYSAQEKLDLQSLHMLRTVVLNRMFIQTLIAAVTV